MEIPRQDPDQLLKAIQNDTSTKSRGIDAAKSILVLLAATLIGYGFYSLGFSEANIVSIYILVFW